MTKELTAAAVDLGAASGRVLVGRIGPDRLDTQVVHRFPNEPITVDGRLAWNVDALWQGILDGLVAAVASDSKLASIGVDTWGVDYGLLDESGKLLEPPTHYRDARTDGVMDRLRGQFGDQRLYETTGLQFMAINTINQLAAERAEVLDRARTLLLVPDLFAYWLTGSVGAERTHASTTQLYDVTSGGWSDWIIEELGLPRKVFPEIREPGAVLGSLLPAVRNALSGADPQVTAVASHDTASAVAAVPAEGERFAYISCGTWSLVGVELPAPVLTAASMAANFTNEVGIDGTIRYLRNVVGLWLLQECLRDWAEAGEPVELADILAAAAAEPARRSVVDAESEEFLAPDGMPERIRAACRRADQPIPETKPALVRCILDSLAVAHARNVRAAQRLSGHSVEVVHVVGGGARNQVLCQLTADACGLPVVAGPVEATALGNLLVQAGASGAIADRADARALVRRTEELHRFEPRDHDAWIDFIG